MSLYSSMGLVAAMALSALVAVWLLYKRSHRDDFPEETWDPYLAQKNREDGGAYLGVDDISGAPQNVGPSTVSGRLMAFGENPAQVKTEDKIKDELVQEEFQDESEFDEQVELLAGESPSQTDDEQDVAEADPNFIRDVSPVPEHPARVFPESSLSRSDSEAPNDVPFSHPAEFPSGESPFDALPAPKDVFYRRTVAELMGVGVINFSPPSKSVSDAVDVEGRSASFSDPPRSFISHEESSDQGEEEPESSDVETTASNEESLPVSEADLSREASVEPTLENPDFEPISRNDEIPQETETSVAPVVDLDREENVQGEEVSFAVKPPTFDNEEDAAPPLIYESEASSPSETGGESSGPVSLSDDASDESVLDEYVSGIEKEEQQQDEEASFTLESLSFDEEEKTEPPVMHEPETAPSQEEYDDSQQVVPLDEFSIYSKEEPDDLVEELDVPLTSENIVASEFEGGDLNSSEEAPMVFEMPSEGQEFIDTEEKAQKIPAGLESPKSVQGADEKPEAPVSFLGEDSIEPKFGEGLKQISDETGEMILDSSGMVDEAFEITLDSDELEEEPEELFDALEVEEKRSEAAMASGEAMEPPKAHATEEPVSEESMDVFSVLESERAESLVDMPEGSIGNAGLFDDEEEELGLKKEVSPEVGPMEPEPREFLKGMESTSGDDAEAVAHDIGSEAFVDKSVFEPSPPREAEQTIAPLSGESMFEVVQNFVSLCCPNHLLLIEEENERFPERIEEIAKAGWDDICTRMEMRKEIEAEEFLRIGILEHMLGRHGGALVHFKEALRRAEKMGPVLNALGVTSFSRGKIDPGISYFKEAIREAGTDVSLLTASNRNLAVLYQSKGDLENAAVSVVSALKCMSDNESPGTLAGLNFRAGQLFRKLGEIENARYHLSESTHLYLRAGDDAARTRSLVALSSVQTELGEYDGALRNLDEAVLLCRNSGDKAGEALVIGQMGVAYSGQDQFTRALECYEKAIILNRSLGNRKGEGANLSNIGNIHYFRGDLNEALAAYEEALEINREQEHVIGQATILGNMGRICIEMKLYQEAIQQLKESLEMFRSEGAQAQVESIQELIEEAVSAQE